MCKLYGVWASDSTEIKAYFPFLEEAELFAKSLEINTDNLKIIIYEYIVDFRFVREIKKVR